jgi:hypothetical protein
MKNMQTIFADVIPRALKLLWHKKVANGLNKEINSERSICRVLTSMTSCQLPVIPEDQIWFQHCVEHLVIRTLEEKGTQLECFTTRIKESENIPVISEDFIGLNYKNGIKNIPIISEDFIGLNNKNGMRTTTTAFADFFPKRMKNKNKTMTIITAFAEFILKKLDNKKETKTVIAEYIPHLVVKDKNILILVVKEVDWVQILSN